MTLPFTPAAQPDLHSPVHAAIPAPRIPLHHAEDLTRGGNLANIALADQVYALRITRAGKLILTK